MRYDEIKQALHDYCLITIVGEIAPVMHRSGDRLVPRASIFVAPKLGVYTLDEMKTFMDCLALKVPPAQRFEFTQHEGHLEIGSLIYYERLGREIETVTREFVLETDLYHEPGCTEGAVFVAKTIKDFSLQTTVSIYPDFRCATDYCQQDMPNFVPTHMLAEYAAREPATKQ